MTLLSQFFIIYIFVIEMEARRCIDSSDVFEYRIPRHRWFYTNHFKNHFKILKKMTL